MNDWSTQRHSLYWDDFERRAQETVAALQTGDVPPVRRVAVFITDRCNFRCRYCNHTQGATTLHPLRFGEVVERYGETAIFHITGGEPSVVPWLYPMIRKLGERYRFHLNTNAYLMPPAESVRRLKVSLDGIDAECWDALVGRHGAFDRVTANIRRAIPQTVVSITFTMTRQNYCSTPAFARFVNEQFPGLYAVFFSVYKGADPYYAFTADDAERFFGDVLPALEAELADESLALLRETIDEKVRLMRGVRFPENRSGRCYLSMSERVIAPDGSEYACSHLYRDSIRDAGDRKHAECLYGCNRRLTEFNRLVERQLERGEAGGNR